MRRAWRKKREERNGGIIISKIKKTENKHFVPKTYQYFISKNDTGEKKWLSST